MASGHVNRIKRPDTWLHRPMLQNVKKVLANPEPSTHDPQRTWPPGLKTALRVDSPSGLRQHHARLPHRQWGKAMRRRDLIYLIGCLAVTPVATFGQQAERIRRIAILMNRAASDPEG